MCGRQRLGGRTTPVRAAKVGRDFEFEAQSQLKPLEAYRDYLTVVSQTDTRMAEPYRAQEIGGDHDRSTAVFLTQSHPLQTQADVFLGVSLDQVHAKRFGQETALPSLEVTTERMDRGGGCAYNYHCAYMNSLAWASPSDPLPAILEPRVVFEQLFGAGSSVADRARTAFDEPEPARFYRDRGGRAEEGAWGGGPPGPGPVYDRYP